MDARPPGRVLLGYVRFYLLGGGAIFHSAGIFEILCIGGLFFILLGYIFEIKIYFKGQYYYKCIIIFWHMGRGDLELCLFL